MDIQAQKLDLIQWIIQLNDERLIKKIAALQSEDKDFWDELPEEQKQEIRKGIAELDNSEKHDYNKVVSKYR
jgi:TRAP-type C4-dicarboxylate transport system substrate-binding protein